tara:strand:- start:406 stop:828 length:423 start_codon:yes stop_codon:yes gene_type:complete
MDVFWDLTHSWNGSEWVFDPEKTNITLQTYINTQETLIRNCRYQETARQENARHYWELLTRIEKLENLIANLKKRDDNKVIRNLEAPLFDAMSKKTAERQIPKEVMSQINQFRQNKRRRHSSRKKSRLKRGAKKSHKKSS